jgi:hypothetical protein
MNQRWKLRLAPEQRQTVVDTGRAPGAPASSSGRENNRSRENPVARRGNSSGESALWTEENEIGRKSQTGKLLTALVRPSLGTAQEIKNKTIF